MMNSKILAVKALLLLFLLRACLGVCDTLENDIHFVEKANLNLYQETILSYIITDECGTFGFYDKKSGYFQPPVYDAVYDSFCTEWECPILVNKNGYWGYVNRKTGEIQIPLRYTAISAYSEFCNGYALAAYENKSSDSVSYVYELINCSGNAVSFPHSVMPVTGMHEDRVIITNQQGDRYGVADVDGHVLVSPKYDFITDFKNGYASVRIGRLWGHIDAAGIELVSPQFEIDDDFGDSGYMFDNKGFATLHMADGSVLIIDAQGQIHNLY